MLHIAAAVKAAGFALTCGYRDTLCLGLRYDRLSLEVE